MFVQFLERQIKSEGSRSKPVDELQSFEQVSVQVPYKNGVENQLNKNLIKSKVTEVNAGRSL